MRYFLNRVFARRLKVSDLSEEFATKVLDDIFAGRSISLGQGLYKIRASAEKRGKRGGYRVVFVWKKEGYLIFCELFGKNAKENLEYREIKALYILAQKYAEFTNYDVAVVSRY